MIEAQRLCATAENQQNNAQRMVLTSRPFSSVMTCYFIDNSSFFAGLPHVSVVSFVLPTERSIHDEMECNVNNALEATIARQNSHAFTEQEPHLDGVSRI